MENAPKAEGYVIIDGRVYPANRVIRALINEGFADVKLEHGGVLVIGGVRVKPVFKSPQEQAMALTCYGSLAYCCGLEKACENRDRALELLGLSKEDYLRLKTYLHNKFIEYSKGLHAPGELDSIYFSREDSSSSRLYRNNLTSTPDRFEAVESSTAKPLRNSTKEEDENSIIEPISTLFDHSEEPKISESAAGNYESGSLFSEENDEFSFCIYCGSKLPPSARYCRRCGKPAI